MRRFSFVIPLLVWLWPLEAPAVPRVAEGFVLEPSLPVMDLLSGITRDRSGVVVCEYDFGRILHLSMYGGEVEVLAEGLETPVDVEYVGGLLWVLLEKPGQVWSINPSTGEKTLLVEGLIEPTAFALGKRQHLYVVEYLEGRLLDVTLPGGEITVLRDGLDGPADLAVFPNGEILVAEQAGLDLEGGTLLRLKRDGRLVSQTSVVVDPTGVAVDEDGTVYVTSFFVGGRTNLLDWGGVIALGKKKMRTVTSGLVGPTSLTILPGGRLAVIEETTNSVLLVDRNGSTSRLARGIAGPSALGAFPDGEIATLEMFGMTGMPLSHSTISIIGDGGVRGPVWSGDFSPAFPPKLACGGDGLLYLFDPLTGRLQVMNRLGETVAELPHMSILHMVADPTGGVVVLTDSFYPERLEKVTAGGVVESHPVSIEGIYGFFMEPGGEAVFLDDSLREIGRMAPNGLLLEGSRRLGEAISRGAGRYARIPHLSGEKDSLPAAWIRSPARHVALSAMEPGSKTAHAGDGGRLVFAPAGAGGIWYAFESEDTLFLREGGRDRVVLENLPGIAALAADPRGGVLVGTRTGGLYAVRKEAGFWAETPTPRPSFREQPSLTPTRTETATAVPRPTDTPTPSYTSTPTPTSTATPTFTPTNTASPTPSPSPTDTPTVSPTPTPRPTDTPTVTPTPTQRQRLSSAIVVSQGYGGGSITAVLGLPDLRLITWFPALSDRIASVLGGLRGRSVNTAIADFDGDGFRDVAVGFGPGGFGSILPSVVSIWRAISAAGEGAELIAWRDPFWPSGRNALLRNPHGAVNLAAGYFVAGENLPMLITAQGLGGNNQISVMQLRLVGSRWHLDVVGRFQGLTGFAVRSNESGGTAVAAGDVDGDGLDELVVGQMNGAASVYSTLFQVLDLGLENRQVVVRHRTGWPTAAMPRGFRGLGGVNLAVGDVDGDGDNEIIAATAGIPDGANHPQLKSFVRVFDVSANRQGIITSIRPITPPVPVFDSGTNPSGGVELGAGNLDNEPGDEIVVGTQAIISLDSDSGDVIVSHPAPRASIQGLKFEFDEAGNFAAVRQVVPLVNVFPGSLGPDSGAVNVEIWPQVRLIPLK